MSGECRTTDQSQSPLELFSYFDTFEFFVSASHTMFEKDKPVNDTQVNTTPVTKF